MEDPLDQAKKEEQQKEEAKKKIEDAVKKLDTKKMIAGLNDPNMDADMDDGVAGQGVDGEGKVAVKRGDPLKDLSEGKKHPLVAYISE